MIAETMAAIRADAFAMTKRQLREPSLERIHDAMDVILARAVKGKIVLTTGRG